MNIFHAINSSLKSYVTKHRSPCHRCLPSLPFSREKKKLWFIVNPGIKRISLISPLVICSELKGCPVIINNQASKVAV